ncbi:MAG: V-type ATP synthase subunit F [Candidatus Saccharicenans sp.]|nr:MAG: hypothetical protein C0168_04425 [Candidatus Aminicenantes bacterium]HEK85394.1 hypothetical protein [Candidatus Aminicenantes bacterium]
MSETSRVAVIGEKDFCLPLRVLGLSIFSPASVEEAKVMLARIVNEKYALCLIQESWLEPLKNELAGLAQKFFPVCLGFSDYRQVSRAVAEILSEISIKATGSDALFIRGRNDHEAR